MPLVHFDKFDQFSRARDVRPQDVIDAVVGTTRSLDERTELEPAFLAILADPNETPHGPAEIVDVLTHKVTLGGSPGVAAFVLKGKAFPTVRPHHVSHQIYRLKKIVDLKYAFLVAPGTILDAAKEQFISTADEIQASYAILDAVDIGRVLIAYGFLCPRDGLRVKGGHCQCGYSPPKVGLNVLQTQVLKNLKEAHELGQRRGLVVMPTGSGKTRIAARDASASSSKKILYVAHTEEILDVAEGEFGHVFGKGNVQRADDGSAFEKPRRVTLSTIQLASRHLGRMDELHECYLVVDEFHHAAARSYRLLIERLTPSFLLGLTATPFRGDRQDIIELCNGNVISSFELRSGIESGVLVPYHYHGCFDDIDYSQIEYKGNRYDVRDLERQLTIPERDAAIVSKWRELADGKPTLAFCCSHRHAERMAKALADAGIPASTYLSTTSSDERRKLTDRLRAGQLKILCTVDVLNEGADFPFVECLLFLRPTESKRIFFQQLGRGLRRAPGKSYCTVVDFIGNFRNAYRIVEYQGLLPTEQEEAAASQTRTRSVRELLNLPLGCQVSFDDRVIEVFEQQANDPRFATRQNIGRILLLQYQRLGNRLGKPRPNPKDVNTNCLLDASFYGAVFGSWAKFQQMLDQSE